MLLYFTGFLTCLYSEFSLKCLCDHLQNANPILKPSQNLSLHLSSLPAYISIDIIIDYIFCVAPWIVMSLRVENHTRF